MKVREISSPMSWRALIDEYFIENRTCLLELAAFLDRLDRAGQHGERDFRMEAFSAALQVLCSPISDRVRRIQMIFSDPRLQPLDVLDRKSAVGAYDRWAEGVRS